MNAPDRRTRILIPIGEPIGGQMSAVGIRQLEIGRALADRCDVTFAAAAGPNDVPDGTSVVSCSTRADFRRLAATHDVLYTLGLNSDRFLDAVRSGIRIVLDIYTPLAFEILESWPEVPTPLLARLHRRVVRWTLAQLSHADFVVCASEPQRDLWLGSMNAAGIIDARASRADPGFRSRIDVVPFGLPDAPPRAAGSPLRMRVPALRDDDFVLLWSSKLLSWQDPVTLIQAMRILEHEEPAIRLVFLGIGPPPPAHGTMFDPAAQRTRETLQAAAAAGLTDRTVFFVTDRVPYRDMGAHYLDADAAVATYPATLETHFCLGSRLLDFVWAGLPLVVSGDEIQRAFVEGPGLGIVVQPGDARGLATAIAAVKKGVEAGSFPPEAFAAARARLRWSVLAEPVVRYCTSPRARERRAAPRAWLARAQTVEFLARSVGCRLATAWHSRCGRQ